MTECQGSLGKDESNTALWKAQKNEKKCEKRMHDVWKGQEEVFELDEHIAHMKARKAKLDQRNAEGNPFFFLLSFPFFSLKGTNKREKEKKEEKGRRVKRVKRVAKGNG